MQILVKLCLVRVEIVALNLQGVFAPSYVTSMNPDLLNSAKKTSCYHKTWGLPERSAVVIYGLAIIHLKLTVKEGSVIYWTHQSI